MCHLGDYRTSCWPVAGIARSADQPRSITAAEPVDQGHSLAPNPADGPSSSAGADRFWQTV